MNKKNRLTKKSKIFIAGHNGLVGSSIVAILKKRGYTNLILRDRNELDLLNQESVELFFKKERPEYVFLAAAKVGGIVANTTYPANFIYENIMIQTNIINSAYKHNVTKLLFLGSSCIYPKFAKQPIHEDYLLTGSLEQTNEAYAVAKIAGITMCQSYNKQYGTNYICAMPTNLYGTNDNFDLTSSHVIPALIRKFHEAKINNEDSVTLWGSGNPRREFLFVDDLAEAAIFLMKKYNDLEIINVGTGKDLTIKELAKLIKNISGFRGKIKWDKSKPDGTPRKVLSTNKINTLGWKPKTTLKKGIEKVYKHYSKNCIDTF